MQSRVQARVPSLTLSADESCLHTLLENAENIGYSDFNFFSSKLQIAMCANITQVSVVKILLATRAKHSAVTFRSSFNLYIFIPWHKTDGNDLSVILRVFRVKLALGTPTFFFFLFFLLLQNVCWKNICTSNAQFRNNLYSFCP